MITVLALGGMILAGTAGAVPIGYPHGISDGPTYFDLGQYNMVEKDAYLDIELFRDGNDPDRWCNLIEIFRELTLITSQDGGFEIGNLDFGAVVAALDQLGLPDVVGMDLWNSFDIGRLLSFVEGYDGCSSPIPEPSAALLFGLGALVVGVEGRRKRG